jgi:hypothetical protein
MSTIETTTTPASICETCGETISLKLKYTRKKSSAAVYYTMKYCGNQCRIKGILKSSGRKPVAECTKKEVHDKEPTRNASRVRIARNAREVYAASGRPRICKKCGYSLHFDVCHIKEINEFPPTALISEINQINNLVALCKNHHWELDNGFLPKSEIV